MFLPNISKANQNYLTIRNSGGAGIGFSEMSFEYIGGSTETNDPDSYDSLWTSAEDNLNSKWLKIHTEPYNVQLQGDARPTNSETLFQAKLSAIDKAGGNVTTTNRLRFVYNTKDSTRFYLAKINCDSNWTPNGQPFSWAGVPTNNQYVYLPGIANCPSGTIYGTLDFDPSFNKLISLSTGNGTNNPQGTEILDYNTNKTVSLTANSGNYIDYYVLTRTTNDGSVSVFTNDFVGTNVVGPTNVTLEGLMGSNSVHAVYSPNSYTLEIQAGGFEVAPTSFTDVVYGGSVTTTVQSIYVTNAPGARKKFTGFEKIQ